jgi:hypothetical protein
MRLTCGAALWFGEADGDERALLGHLVEVRHTLGLGVVVVEDPVFRDTDP